MGSNPVTRFDEILNDLQDTFGVHPLWQEVVDEHERVVDEHRTVLRMLVAAATAALASLGHDRPIVAGASGD